MRRIGILLTLLILAISVSAQQRSLSDMSAIAQSYFNNKVAGEPGQAKGSAQTARSVSLKAMSSALTQTATTDNEAFAVYAPENGNGFVIVSADEQMPEILAYSDNQKFSKEKGKNPALTELLENYATAYNLITSGKATTAEIFGTTTSLQTSVNSATTRGPILGNIAYDQDDPYNRLCPLYNNERTVTGCVATSMAQIMRYYRYPAHGTGDYSYTTDTRKLKASFDFANTTFDWNSMLDNYINGVDDWCSSGIHATGTALAFDNGGIANLTADDTDFDTSAPYLKVTNIGNATSKTLNGYMQLVIYNSDYSVFRSASNLVTIKNMPSHQGWSYGYMKPILPSDLADGTYSLSIAFTTDQSKYILTKSAFSSSASDYSQTITKSGDNYTFSGKTFHTAATVAQANSVATLMYACGVAAESDYDTEANNGTAASGLTAYAAMNKYFSYDPDMFFVYSDYSTTDQIHAILKEYLDKDQPVPVAGMSSDNDGHSFIIDGYDLSGTSPKYHINWGWSGNDDGNYLLTNMSPPSAGIGGSAVNYSSYYEMYFNIQPDNNTSDGDVLSASSISVGKKTVATGGSVQVSFSELFNSNINNNITKSIYCYLVSTTTGKAYKTSSFIRLSGGILKPRQGFSGSSEDVSIPTNVPNGTYRFEFRVNAGDHFFCASNPVVTVTGSTVAVDDIQATANNGISSPSYSITGMPTNGKSTGIIITNGKKHLAR